MVRRRSQSDEIEILNPEQVAARRVAVPDENVTFWKCEYCKKLYQDEGRYMKHVCPTRDRQELLKSPVGQAAFDYYNTWMRAQGYGTKTRENFEKSKRCRQFLKFAEFATKIKLNKPGDYIRLMVSLAMDITLWSTDSNVSLYRSTLDIAEDPYVAVEENVRFLMQLAEKEDIQLADLAVHLGPQRIIDLLRNRQISLWVLLRAPTFTSLIKAGTFDEEHLEVVKRFMAIDQWNDKYPRGSETSKNIVAIFRGVGL